MPGARRRGLAGAADVRVGQRPRDARPRWRPAGVSLPPSQPAWAGSSPLKHTIDRVVRAGRAGRARARCMLAIAIAVRARLAGAGAVPAAPRRTRRPHEFDLLKFRTMRVASRAASQFRPVHGSAPGVESRARIAAPRSAARCVDVTPRRAAAADQRAAGRDEPDRPAPRAPRVRRAIRPPSWTATAPSPVKSGITGWAQVNGLRGQTSIADRVEWDNYYIRNWSLRLDLRIVALTLLEVLHFRG